MKNRFSPGIWLILLSFMALSDVIAQQESFEHRLFSSYEDYKEESLSRRRIKFADIAPLISQYHEGDLFEVNKVGSSIEGRPLYMLSAGEGETDVLLWSQMHGDEATATRALFDIFKFLSGEGFQEEKEMLLKNLRIHFLPMLNPDGAEVFDRRNALGVDINRDALRLQSPESQTLKRIRDSLNADFGFNLHDQSKYYNVGRTGAPASISFLAPAYNYAKEVNPVREKAIKLIVAMNEVMQDFAPGRAGRYNDDFEPRAFGDNIQKWGTSTVLVESGGSPGDPEKEKIRKLNYVLLLSALRSIAQGGYQVEDMSDYKKIPENDRMLFDLKLEGLTHDIGGKKYILDVGVNRNEHDIDKAKDFYYTGSIVDQGDLSTSFGYENLDADGLSLRFGKLYPQVLKDTAALGNLDFSKLLSEGYAYVRLEHLPKGKFSRKYPVHLVSKNFKVPQDLKPGTAATFFLVRRDEVEHAVINGFLTRPKDASSDVKNTLIYR